MRGRELYLTIKQQVLTRFFTDLENRRARKEFSYLTAAFSCIMSDYRDKPRLHSQRQRESNRLQNRKFLSGMKEKTRLVRQRKKLPREAVRSPSLETQETQLGTALRTMTSFQFSSAQGREVRPNHHQASSTSKWCGTITS